MRGSVLAALAALFFTAPAMAQQPVQPPVYRVEADTLGGFILHQDGRHAAFDTASVAVSLRERQDRKATIQKDIATIERLLSLKEQLAAAQQEEGVLADILAQARVIAAQKPKKPAKEK